jgi:NADPH:quinone reductase-like Zn-dependent oxidoreductase
MNILTRVYLRASGTGGTHGFDVDGSHAQWISVPESVLQFMEMPANLSFEEAAGVGVPFLTAWLMVEKANLKKGQYVLVLGIFQSTVALFLHSVQTGSSGGVGTAAVQIARLKGAIPIESSRRLSENAVNITEEILPQVLQKTGGQALSAVLDSVGDAVLFKKALASLGPSGN